MISPNLVEELKIIIKGHYGKDLEIEKVAQIAENLVGYFDLLLKIYHREKMKNNYEDNKPKNN